MKNNCTIKEHNEFRVALWYRIRIPKSNCNKYKMKKFIEYINNYPYYRKWIERINKWLPFKDKKLFWLNKWDEKYSQFV